MRPFAILALVAVAIPACGLGLVGTSPVAGDADAGITEGPDGATPPPAGDAGADAPVQAEAGPCSSGATTCTSALPAGWTALAFASDRSATCPAGWTSADLVASPVAAAGACTCACQIANNDPPTCAKGTFTSMIGTTNTCGSTGATYTFAGTACTALATAGTSIAYGKATPLGLTRGTCNPSVATDLAKLTTTAVRACVPPDACAEDVCNGAGPAPFASCIAHDGDVACPSGPFANKTVTGPSATLACGGCATCQNDGTCGPAKLHWFNDSACATEIASRNVDGNCNGLASGSAGSSVSYAKYDVAVQNATCTPTSTPTTSATLDTPRTICCR